MGSVSTSTVRATAVPAAAVSPIQPNGASNEFEMPSLLEIGRRAAMQAEREAIERVLAQAKTNVMMEIAMGQEPAIRELAAIHRYDIDAVINDLAGIPRVVVLSARGRR